LAGKKAGPPKKPRLFDHVNRLIVICGGHVDESAQEFYCY